jgi:hypothetical protein
MTFEEVATRLNKGAVAPDWVIERLRQKAELVGYHTKLDGDDSIERLLFESALHLENWLSMYSRIEKRFGIEMPDCIDQVSTGLADLIPFLAEQIKLPSKGGPIPDARRHLCAAACSGIWEELHGHEPYSEKLWEACEAYWQACGHPETSTVSRLRNWERYLLELSPP